MIFKTSTERFMFSQELQSGLWLLLLEPFIIFHLLFSCRFDLLSLSCQSPAKAFLQIIGVGPYALPFLLTLTRLPLFH